MLGQPAPASMPITAVSLTIKSGVAVLPGCHLLPEMWKASLLVITRSIDNPYPKHLIPFLMHIGNLSAVRNVISNFSRIRRTYTPGIAFSSVGLYVANNSISHGPHCGITGGGSKNIFEYNEISHVSFECTDTGAFYVGRSRAKS